MENAITKIIGIQHPILLAPMAGGPSTPALAAAVSNAGGLGSLGGNYLSPTALREEIQKTKALTKKHFAVNLFIPNSYNQPAEKETQEMLDYTNDIRRKLSLPPLEKVPPTKNNFEEQMEVVLQEKPAVFSYVFGRLDPRFVSALKKENIKIIGTATALEEALQIQDDGADAVALQGFEGGGHRGVFANNKDLELPLHALLELVRLKLKIPIIAAGGIMNGHDIKKALKSGADGVQLGTAFLLCKEAGTSQCYREALMSKHPGKHTEITDAFSGRKARGIVNQFMKEFKAKSKIPLPFPIQNTLTQDIRKKSTEMGISDYCSLWAGTGLDHLRDRAADLTATEIIEVLVKEMEEKQI